MELYVVLKILGENVLIVTLSSNVSGISTLERH